MKIPRRSNMDWLYELAFADTLKQLSKDDSAKEAAEQFFLAY